MIKTADEMMKLQNEMFAASNAVMTRTLESIQKLAALNMQTARSSMEDSAELMKAMMAAKDLQVLAGLMNDYAKSSPDAVGNYARAVYAISKESGEDFATLVEQQIAAGKQQINAAIESMAKNAPAGAEGAIGFMKQAMAAADVAFEQAKAASNQFVKTAEANVESASKTATAARKR